MLNRVHELFFWPFLIFMAVFAGATKAGWQTRAEASAETTGAVNTIIQYVPEPSKQLEALGDIKI